MIISPCCKINIGLNVVAEREDGYHDIETVFYPVRLCDTLSVEPQSNELRTVCALTVSGNIPIGNADDNSVVEAYRLVASLHKLPPVKAELHKNIPSQAGLGGGSADAAFMIKLLNKQFALGMGNDEMRRIAARIGADCAFFIDPQPCYATGVGERLEPLTLTEIKGYYLAIVKPDVAISTAEAYSHIASRKPAKSCREIVNQPLETWKSELSNDFEEFAFARHPILAEIKKRFYSAGAVYSQMSGSGSAMFALFASEPSSIAELYPGLPTFVTQL